MRDIRVATVQFQHAAGHKAYNLGRIRHFVQHDNGMPSGRRWLRARRPELYESLTRPTGQEQETRRVRFGE